MELNPLSNAIIGAAIEVHKILGPGLLEHVYRDALVYELRLRGFKAESEAVIPVVYKGVKLELAFRADIIVENEIILELKATDKITPVFKKQLLTYLKLSGKRLGLLMNFNEVILTKGITRLVNNF